MANGRGVDRSDNAGANAGCEAEPDAVGFQSQYKRPLSTRLFFEPVADQNSDIKLFCDSNPSLG